MKNKPTIAISPVSNDYLTEGKEYEIIFIKESRLKERGYYFHIRCDERELVITHEHDSLHTDRLSWTLK